MMLSIFFPLLTQFMLFEEKTFCKSRLSRTEETMKIELSINHYPTTNYHFLHFYIELKLRYSQDLLVNVV